MKNHQTYKNILDSRGITSPICPIWKMNISAEEFENLRICLLEAYNERTLEYYGREAALYYAEWWRRKYCGGAPSKEDVAVSIGLPKDSAQDLYLFARKALSAWKIQFIHDRKYHYFRTLLLQGGLPMNHIKSNRNDFNSYKLFLNSLVRELSQFNADWNDTEVVSKLNCISYLPKSFNTYSIHDLSLRIAHAIIENREDLLPYDSNSGELRELTKSLKEEHERVQRTRSRQPFAFRWELSVKDGNALLRYSLESIRTVYSSTLSGLNPNECYQFDLFVSQKYVATYKRTHIDEDRVGEYRRMNFDNKSFEWKDAPFVDVKLVCDNGDNLFITVAGCYPPDFSYPQVAQKNGNMYTLRKQNACAENYVIYTAEWGSDDVGCERISLHDRELNVSSFSTELTLHNHSTGEALRFTNRYLPYTIEYKGVYIDWIEESNFKLLDKVPLVTVYDENNQLVQNLASFYRLKTESMWKKIQRYTVLPAGLIEIKVELPDGRKDIETFYSIQNLHFSASKEREWDACIQCKCAWGTVQNCKQDGLSFEIVDENEWRITRDREEENYPTTCSFVIFKENMPSLRLTIPSPFKGLSLVGEQGELLKSGEILSLSNLGNYKVVEHGIQHPKISFSYLDKANMIESIRLTVPVTSGITPLCNYEEIIERLFNLYGYNSFDRESAVVVDLNGKSFKIRKFVLDTIKSGCNKIDIPGNLPGEENERYVGRIFACPVDVDILAEDLNPVELVLQGSEYALMQETSYTSFIVFSDVYDRKRIIPKFYKLTKEESQSEIVDAVEDTGLAEQLKESREGKEKDDFSIQERKSNQASNIEYWMKILMQENICTGSHWKQVIASLEIANQYRLPFRTFNSVSAAVASPYLCCKLLLSLFVDNKRDLLISEIQRLEREFAIAIHWIRPTEWTKVLDDLNIYPEAVSDVLFENFPQFVQELLCLTLDPQSAETFFRFIGGSLPNVDKDFLSCTEINEFRSRAVGKTDNNQDLPVYKINLVSEYYKPLKSFRPYQYTMINAPLRVYEYLQGKDDSLWTRDFDCLHVRRIINFYRRYFVRTYCEILTRMLN